MNGVSLVKIEEPLSQSCKESLGSCGEERGGSSFGWRTVMGILYCAVACCFFSCMNGFSKHLYNTSNITTWEIVYWRSLALVLCNLLTAQFSGSTVFAIPKKISKALLWRVITGFIGMAFLFLQTKVMSFSKATSIFFIYPGFTMIFAYLIMNEKITRYDIISCILSFCGVIVIVFDPNGSKKINETEVEAVWAPIVPFLASIFCALGDVFTRVLGSDIHPALPPAYFGIGGCICAPVLIQLNYYLRNAITNYNSEIILCLFLIGASGFLGQLLLTKAFQLEKAGRIAVISYLQMVNACVIDITVFHIPLRGLQYFGIFLVLVSGGGLMVLKGFDIIK
eukprot:TRINITY_DN7010_c0_g1_i13.p1 TRINITY_DN7010_c0_g1~~TRINITY_DN7010_c0_g1_i13.p1  ORF type:complete len:338 (-),score=48.25 TRINITY_DN7010_c0_g1_i13:154-1167(-)